MKKLIIASLISLSTMIMLMFSINAIEIISDSPFRTTPQIILQNNEVFGFSAIIGLRADGTISIAGSEKALEYLQPMTEWDNIVKLSNCGNIGLKADGTVISVSDFLLYDYEKTDISEIKNWDNINDIAEFNGAVLGLRNDGTVLHIGYPFKYTEYYTEYNYISSMIKINEWSDIKTLGKGDIPCAVKNDGTVVSIIDEVNEHTKEWKDINSFIVTAGWNFEYYGLKNDGLIIGSYYQENWENVVSFSVIDNEAYDSHNSSFKVALKSDGTVMTSSYSIVLENWDGLGDPADYISYVNHPITELTNIISVSIVSYSGELAAVAALTSDGRVLVYEETKEYKKYRLQDAVADWNLFDVDDNTIEIGNLSGNAKIGTADLIILAKSLAGRIELTENQKLAADLNDDGEVNIDDLLVFIKYLVGAISTLPYNG